jgi:hypothetical protein
MDDGRKVDLHRSNIGDRSLEDLRVTRGRTELDESGSLSSAILAGIVEPSAIRVIVHVDKYVTYFYGDLEDAKGSSA